MSATLRIAVGSAFRRTALPLLSYYTLTLAVPLVNGAALSDTAFVRHALTVLLVPPFAIMLTCVVATAGSSNSHATYERRTAGGRLGTGHRG